MNVLESWEDTTIKVESVLSDYCNSKINEAVKVGDGYVQLWNEIKLLIEAGGKRLRPYLICLMYGAYGGNNKANIIQIATAWEMLHTSLLVHDDIIDRDIIRHHTLNIAGKYEKKYRLVTKKDESHFAMSMALLAGDLLLIAPYEIVDKSDLSAEDKLVVHSYLQSAFFYTGGGELLDVEASLYPLSSSDPIAVAHYKTAIYTFQLPIVCGAKLAGASEPEIKKLESIGLEIGIAFQLRDDLLGVFGDRDTTGKSNRSDIIERKRTILTLEAQKRLTVTKSKRLEELYDLNRLITKDEVEEAVKLLTESGARDAVETEISIRTKRARGLVESLDIGELYKSEITNLIDKVEIRES